MSDQYDQLGPVGPVGQFLTRERWSQGTYCKRNGIPINMVHYNIDPNKIDEYCFCVSGAICYLYKISIFQLDESEPIKKLMTHLCADSTSDIFSWNDKSDYDTVIEAIRKVGI